MIILYTGFGISMSVFMMTGYIKSIPKDIEESAVIDGANIMQAFFYIMLPLIKPMTITIIILNGMWIWNDYLLPFLVLETSDFKTITLEIYYVKMTAGQESLGDAFSKRSDCNPTIDCNIFTFSKAFC